MGLQFQMRASLHPEIGLEQNEQDSSSAFVLVSYYESKLVCMLYEFGAREQ